MTPLAARILEGKCPEKRLPRKVNVPREFLEPLASQQGPETFIVQTGFILLAEGTGGGISWGFLGSCGPELSWLEPYYSLLPKCTAWWLSNSHGLWPRSSGPSLLQPWWLPLAQETRCAPVNGLEVLSSAGHSWEVLKEAEVWRDIAGCLLTPGA